MFNAHTCSCLCRLSWLASATLSPLPSSAHHASPTLTRAAACRLGWLIRCRRSSLASTTSPLAPLCPPPRPPAPSPNPHTCSCLCRRSWLASTTSPPLPVLLLAPPAPTPQPTHLQLPLPAQLAGLHQLLLLGPPSRLVHRVVHPRRHHHHRRQQHRRAHALHRAPRPHLQERTGRAAPHATFCG